MINASLRYEKRILEIDLSSLRNLSAKNTQILTDENEQTYSLAGGHDLKQ